MLDLYHAVELKTHIPSSLDFIQKILNNEIPPDHKIISLGVVSFFTNVQIGIAIKGIKERWVKIQPHVNIPWYQFKIRSQNFFIKLLF